MNVTIFLVELEYLSLSLSTLSTSPVVDISLGLACMAELGLLC